MTLRNTLLATAVTTAFAISPFTSSALAEDGGNDDPQIRHIVVIFQENVSFDHYFGTYPNATNPAGEPAFNARPGTPSVNGLSPALLTSNPNGANPMRLDRSQALTCDQDHGYTDEQKAYDAGAVDKFMQFGAGGSCTDKTIVMDYFDGNTVTAWWNYAQHFAMSDNFYDTTYGPSTPGALNLISGQTHGATPNAIAGAVAQGSVIGDPRPFYDDCSSGATISMSGQNVGNLLNGSHLSWGWFQGGFRPTGTSNGKAVCGASHKNIGGNTVTDYIPHHEPFQYYASTSNPHHLPPTSTALIGHQGDQANHQYDLVDFWSAVKSGNMPAVSFLKAAAYQDGHAGYSDPLDEQTFLVDTINRLQLTPEWPHTVIFITYDDSDGWYDHVMPPLISPSNDAATDALTGPGNCGTSAMGSIQDRCGYGPRLVLLAVSPFAKDNFVDHSITDQSSILRFIEENFSLGQIGGGSFDAKAGSLKNLFDFANPRDVMLILNSQTGEVTGDNQNDQ